MSKDSFAKMNRRDVLRLIGGAAGAGVLSACAPQATQAPAPTDAPAVPATEAPAMATGPGASVIPKAASGGFDGEITFAISAGPEADAHTRNITKFNEIAAPLQCRVEEVGRDVFLSTWTTNFQSQSDAWDCCRVTGSEFQQAGPAGWILPMEEFLGNSELVDAEEFDVDDWPKAILDLFRLDGKLYEFPQECSANMFFYRTDLVDQFGLEHPPDEGFTWQALIANAREAKTALEAEGMDETYPLILPFGLEQIGAFFYQNVWGYGGEMYLDGKMPNYNCPEGKAVLADMKAWYDEGLCSPGATGWGYGEILIAMQQGGGIYMTQWNASAPDLLNAEKSPITAGNMGFSLWPYDEGQPADVLRFWPSVWALAVSVFSKHPDEAFSYNAWFTSKEVAKDYVLNGGGSSGRASLLTDPEVLAKNPQFGPMGKGLALYHPEADVASASYLRKEVISRWLHGCLTGEHGIDEALDGMTEEATNYLQDQGEI